MIACRFLLFGPPQFETSAGHSIMVRPRKGIGLLACLALAGGKPVSRDQLCALLWSDRQTAQARASLRQLLVDLRRDFNKVGDVIEIAADSSISLKGAAVESDLADFQRFRRADDRMTLERVFALRRGQFIEGLAPEDAAFANWIEDNRRTIDAQWSEATARLLRVLEREGDHRRSLEIATQVLSVDPLCELAHQSVIRAHLAMNNRSLALRHYQQFREKLDRELGVEPDALTQHVIRTVSTPQAVPTGSVGMSAPAAVSRKPKACIAVLPFELLSRTTDDLHFAEGLTEDLRTGLSRFADLAVFAPASVREHVQSGRDRGRPLAADYLVRGIVRRAGQRLRVSASLVHAADDTMLWSEHFDREFADIFALQDDIVRCTVAVLAGRIEAFEMASTLQKPVIDYEAYDLFLKARFLQQGNSEEGILAARFLLRDAITREPNFASAYAELSIGYVLEYESDWCPDYSAARYEALAIARQAVASDQTNSNAHRALAMAEFYCNLDFDAAKAHAGTALAQNPNDQFTICLLGFALTCNGKVAERQHFSAESFKLNPLAPESCFFTLALGAYLDGRYADAVNGFVRVSRVYEEALACMAAALWKLGQHNTANAAMERFMAIKRKKMASYPGDNAEQWRAYFLRLIPITDRPTLEKFFEGLHQAGLPV